MRYLITFSAILFSVYSSFSQTIFVSDVERLAQIEIETNLENLAHAYDIPDYLNRKAKTYFKEYLYQRSFLFKDLCENGYIVHEHTLEEYITPIIRNLESHTNKEKGYFKIYFARDNVVNASSWGAGIIVINFGILERIKSIEELAFVLAHEMNHDLKNHGLERLAERAERAANKTLKKELKRDTKKGGNKIWKLRRELILNKYKYSRKNEFEADEEAAFLLDRSGYDLAGAIYMLDILDNADYFQNADTVHLKESFSTEDFSFDESWIEKEVDAPLWGRQDKLFEIQNEYKTHPDIERRKNNLLSAFDLTVSDSRLEPISSEVNRLARYNGIDAMLYYGNYGFALFNAINNYKTDSNNYYLHVKNLSLFMIGNALKNNEFSKTVEFKSDKFPYSYNDFLEFLHGLNSSKLHILFNESFNQLEPDYSTEIYRIIEIYHLQLNEPEKDISDKINEFKLLFPKSNFNLNI